MIPAELFREFALRPHLLLDLVNVIEIVGEGRVDIGERDRRNVGDNFVGCHTLLLMPYYDIEYTDPVARDAGFTAADADRSADPIFRGSGHDFSIEGFLTPTGLYI